MSRVLHLSLRGLYFRQIRALAKEFEFRVVTPYWEKRIVGREYDEIELTLGYPRAGDDSRRIRRPWLGFERQTITHPHFGSEPVQVFAIRVNPEQSHG